MEIDKNIEQYNIDELDVPHTLVYVMGDDYDKQCIDFYCGPSYDGGYISDSVFCYDYLEKLFEENNIDVEVGIAENHHLLYFENRMKYNEIKRLIHCFENNNIKASPQFKYDYSH